MPTGIDLDLEGLDAGTAYSVYSMTLVSLAIRMNKNENLMKSQREVDKYADRLHETLTRCGIETEIRRDFSSADEVIPLDVNQPVAFS